MAQEETNLLEPVELAGEGTIDEIYKSVKAYRNDETVVSDSKLFKINSTNRFVKSAAKLHNKGLDKVYNPVLKIFQVIWVNFSGIGSELDNEHMAIIINCNQTVDTLTILPLTSFKNESTKEDQLKFSIGKLNGQNKKSVALFSQITTISRKRVNNHTLRNYRGKDELVFLTEDQKRLVKMGLSVNLLKEKFLFEELVKNEKKLPILEDPSKQYFHLKYSFTKVVEKSNLHKLVYTIEGSSEEFSVLLVPYRGISRKERKYLLNSWYKLSPKLNSSGKIEKSRQDVREELYNKILSFREEN